MGGYANRRGWGKTLMRRRAIADCKSERNEQGDYLDMFMSLMLQAVYVMRWIKMAKVPLHTAGQEVGNRENG